MRDADGGVDAANPAHDVHSDAVADQRDSSGVFPPESKGFPLQMERFVPLLNKAIRQGLPAELTVTTEGGDSITFKVGARTVAHGDGEVDGRKHCPYPRSRGGVPRDQRKETNATAMPPGLSPGGTHNFNRQSSENQRQPHGHSTRRAAAYREQMRTPSAAAPAIEDSAREVANIPSQTRAASPSSEDMIMEVTGASLPDARKALLTAHGDVDRAAETLLAPAVAPAAPAVCDTSAEGNANAQSISSNTRPTTRSRHAAAPAPTIDDLLATNPHRHQPQAAGHKKGREMPGRKPEDSSPSSRTGKSRGGKG